MRPIGFFIILLLVFFYLPFFSDTALPFVLYTLFAMSIVKQEPPIGLRSPLARDQFMVFVCKMIGGDVSFQPELNPWHNLININTIACLYNICSQRNNVWLCVVGKCVYTTKGSQPFWLMPGRLEVFYS